MVVNYLVKENVDFVSVPVRGMRDLYGGINPLSSLLYGFRPRQGNEGFVYRHNAEQER